MITKQSDLHYVKKSADKLRQINKKIDFALKTFFMKDPFNYMGFTVNSIFCRFVRVEQWKQFIVFLFEFIKTCFYPAVWVYL